jgi:hypothetical protein
MQPRGLGSRSEGAMGLRVTRAQVDPATHDEVLSHMGQDVAAASRRRTGHQSWVGGVDRASGRLITVSTWDTEDHARYSLDALGDIPSRLQALGVQPAGHVPSSACRAP